MRPHSPPHLRLAAAAAAVAALVGGCAPELPRSPSGELDPRSLRDLALGAVMGTAAPHDTHAWLGLPYAAAPTGDLRWRAPRQPLAWSGTRRALADAPACTQFDPRESGELIGSEDCLYLNLFAPRMGPEALPVGSERLPVLVWIHGGGNTVGAPNQTDPTRLVREHRVIVVAAAYRLGAFGWFRHPSLSAGDAADRSGNFGILDQLAALRWVQEHIAAFGGDPYNVTVFGESAGGRDVAALLASPLADGLFHRAIIQSGGARSIPPALGERFEDAADPGLASSSGEILLTLLQRDGRASDRQGAAAELARWAPQRVAEYLRGKPPEEILSAYPRRPFGMYDLPQMFRDGAVLPASDLYTAYRRGHAQRAPAIFGTNRDEAKLFMLGEKHYVASLLGYPRLRNPARYERDAGYRSQLWKARGADELASALDEGGGRAYVYRFDWDELANSAGLDYASLLGAAHALELPFVFGNFDNFVLGEHLYDESNASSRKALSEAMMSYWVAFARRGEPGRGRGGRLPEWRVWRSAEDAPEFLVLDSDADGGIRLQRGRTRPSQVIDAVRADASFETQQDRCHLLSEMSRAGETFDPQRLAAAGCPGALLSR